MKMKEKYRDEIINFEGAGFCSRFIAKHVLPFYGKECAMRCSHCRALLSLWLEEEYTEPEQTFECDELVEVSDNGEDWVKRYYAFYENGNHYCWCMGATSITVAHNNDVMIWKYIRKCEQ